MHLLKPLALKDTTTLKSVLLAEQRFAEAISTACMICEQIIEERQSKTGRPAARIQRQLLRGQIPKEDASIPARLHQSLGLIREAEHQLSSATTKFKEALTQEWQRCAEYLADIAQDNRFREAVAWQNRQALTAVTKSFVRPASFGWNRKCRRGAEMVATYLQRYCAKNDTIGFFGPVGWGEFSSFSGIAQLKPGRSLLKGRRVHFEYWAIHALATQFAEIPGVRHWLAPRISPSDRLEEDCVIAAIGRKLALPKSTLSLLRLCNGQVSANEIAEHLCADPESEFENAASVFQALQSLTGRKVLDWTFDIPVAPHPERSLRAGIHTIGDSNIRDGLLESLDNIEQAYEKLLDTEGDGIAAEAALQTLEYEFTQQTGKRSTRLDGQLYAGRTLVYQDYERDFECELGAGFMNRLRPVLTELLNSARWYTWKIEQRLQTLYCSAFDQLVTQHGGETLPLTVFISATQHNITTVRALVDSVSTELQEHWARILDFDPAERRVERTFAQLQSSLQSTFTAPGPGWHYARYHAPDLMIAADGPEAFKNGDYEVVIGEIHVGTNTIMTSTGIAAHPQSDLLKSHTEQDIPEEILIPIGPRERPGHRTNADTISGHNIHLAMNDGTSWRPDNQVINVSQLYIVKEAGRLVIRERNSNRTFDLTACYHYLFRGPAILGFHWMAPQVHSPRITIDDVVIARESWRLQDNDVQFAKSTTLSERFLGANRLRSRKKMPQHVFIRTPLEKKPTYIDFHSPVSVERLCKWIRAAVSEDPQAKISVSEMLPSPEQTWLVDKEGQRYTSELRIVAVDQKAVDLEHA